MQQASSYAEEGTAAHALLEMCLRLHSPPEALHGVNIHEDYHVDDDMVDAVGHAYDYVTAWLAEHPGGYVGIEEEVHWGAWCKSGKLTPKLASGTADVVLMYGLDMRILDYKHGAGKVVEVTDNPQAKLYALGALAKFNGGKATKNVTIGIIQPRARHVDGPVREQVISIENLKKWFYNVVEPAALAALKANAPREAGKWCKWCPAAPTCRALIDHIMAEAGTEFNADPLAEPIDPTTLNDSELSRAMAAADLIEAWAHAVRGRVLAMLLSGRPLDGWKLVAGRSTRDWREDAVPDVLAQAHAVLGDPKLYAPRMLLSPAQLEKAYQKLRQGKQFRESMPQYIARSTPGAHVAPATDPRPEYTPGSEFDALL